MSNYRYTRDWENQQKRLFTDYDVAGDYDIPIIRPEYDFHSVKWIPFNKSKTTQKRKGVGIHHFIDDYQFVREWKNIDAYVDLFRQFDYVMSPDFSMYTDFPKALQMYNHFRKHWIGAYLQEKGVHVIPTISWSTPDSFDWCFDGEPRESVVAVSSVGCNRVLDKFVEGYNAMIQALNPSTIIFYGKIPNECKGNIIHVKSYGSQIREAIIDGWSQ